MNIAGIVAAALGGAATGAMQSGVDDIVLKQKEDAIAQRDKRLKELEVSTAGPREAAIQAAKAPERQLARDQITADKEAAAKSREQIAEENRQQRKSEQAGREAQAEQNSKDRNAQLAISNAAHASAAADRTAAAKAKADDKKESDDQKAADRKERDAEKERNKWVKEKNEDGTTSYWNESEGIRRKTLPPEAAVPENKKFIRTKDDKPLFGEDTPAKPAKPERTVYTDDQGREITGYREKSPTKSAPAVAAAAAEPPAGAIARLRANPLLRDDFDIMFGPGASARYLKR